MLEKNTINSNTTKEIDIFLDCTFSKLGLNYANLGIKYLKEVIKIAYFNNSNDLKYKELCDIASKSLNISITNLTSNIYNSINSINVNIAKRNFKDVFNIDFDYFYISPKKFTILLLNLLYNKF